MFLPTLLHLTIITTINFFYACLNSTKDVKILSALQVMPVCREYKQPAFSTLSNTCESFLKSKSVNFCTSIWLKHLYSTCISAKF